MSSEGKSKTAFSKSNSKRSLLNKCSEFKKTFKSYISMLGVENPYTRIIDSPAAPKVTKNGKTLVMLGSNNYLGLSMIPEVKEAAKQAVDTYGTGCCSSRPLAGTTNLHIKAEKELADFKGAEAVLLFSTGYMTMMGTISSLTGENDVIISDQLNHASIIDGARLSRAKVKVYSHSDMESLEENLASCEPDEGKLVVTDGVFSITGDVANLPEIKRLADKYGAIVMVDDAHGTGVLGENGRGILEYYHMENQIELVCCTFSKVFSTVGGAVCAEKDIIEFIRFNSRPFIFTASLPASVVATVLASIRILKNSGHLLKQLRRNTKFLHDGLAELKFRIGINPTPIIPLYIGDDIKTMRMAADLEEEGIFVNPVIPPGVSAETSLLRISAMASLSKKELEFSLDKFKLVGKRLGLI